LNKKWIVTGTLLAATLMFASYHLFQNKEKSLNGERYQSALVSPETMLKGEEKQNVDFSNYRRAFSLVVLLYYCTISVLDSQRGNHGDDCLSF